MLFHFHLYNFGQAGVAFGWLGVQLFFVLSGFLITRILLKDKQQSFSFYMKRFYWRRSLRIFPLYFAYLLAIAALFLVTGKPEGFSEKAGYLFSYTYNYSLLSPNWSHHAFFTHLWSLSVEEQFYIVWPPLIYFLSTKWLKRVIIAVIALGPVARLLAGHWLLGSGIEEEVAGEAVYWLTSSHLDAFAIGGAITVFNLQATKLTQGKYLLFSFLAVMIMGGFSLWSLESPEISSLGYPVGNMQLYAHVWSYTLLNIFFALTLLYVLASKKSMPLLSNKFAIAIGRVSYGMYLFHWAILEGFSILIRKYIEIDTFAFSALVFAVYLLLVYLVSEISFRSFEIFFINMKDKQFKKEPAISTEKTSANHKRPLNTRIIAEK